MRGMGGPSPYQLCSKSVDFIPFKVFLLSTVRQATLTVSSCLSHPGAYEVNRERSCSAVQVYLSAVTGPRRLQNTSLAPSPQNTLRSSRDAAGATSRLVH